MGKLIDVSMPLSSTVPIWPGDTLFAYELTWTKEESGSVNVGQITMSTHTGTHIDAPFHFDSQGERVLELDLDLYAGTALVVDVRERDCVRPEDLESEQLDGIQRVLLKTGSWKDRSVFPAGITCLHESLAPYLFDKGVRLIGVDVPSVDPLDSKELPAHHALHGKGIHILEGLVLDDIEPGEYHLMALPLPLKEGDGSPVRAVLSR
ncbi:Kynurenine formamidase [Fictibacillus enclensis]|uniref:Kynurenine formamidase n=1 Tax=Fictibacillus enclensis TaxID=1017270 RepID=A0A0V8J8Z9_9BACL|nr:arylformamidase [Fictibacillus enclensis]KSU83451.1 kynurenine formamidase [Fictibacillus enclensis]SCC15708.1 Kynurenine formamidase [Fictibacillus enclensis]